MCIFLRTVFLFFIALPCLVHAGDYAATNIRVVNDRWPDAGSPESFGRDAIRLAGAVTEEEQAIAVWRFIQQMTVVGTVPKEPAYDNFYIVSPEKLLNVYGVQWCDGLSRVMTMTWRALGYRADKLYKFGHTLADIHYRDTDGVERWHVFDLSQHWFVYDRTGTHIATKQELALDHSLLYYPSRTPVPAKPSPMQPSWVHAGHLKIEPHSMGINLGVGDRVEFQFGNEGKPYMDLFPSENRRDFEHGPYPLTYGNGRLVRRIDADRIEDGQTISIELPYVISDAFLNASGHIKEPDGFFRISLSTDGGVSWKIFEEIEPNPDGTFQVKEFDFCSSFDPRKTRKIKDTTPFGRYSYQIRIEMDHCLVDDIEINTVFQHNLFALPMLWPGVNRISVGGLMPEGIGIKVAYRWEDARGSDQFHEKILGALPSKYLLSTHGDEWEDVRCQTLSLEAVAIEEKIGALDIIPFEKVEIPQLPFPTEKSIGIDNKQVPDFERDSEDLEKGLQVRDASLIGDRIVALGALQDPRSAPVLKRVVVEDTTRASWHKVLACQALFKSVGKDAAPFLMRVLENDPAIHWAQPTGKWSADAMWLHTAAVAVAILADIDTFPERDKTADIIAATLKGERTKKPLAQLYRGSEVGWGLIRALGHLGDSRHVPFLTRYLADKGDAAAVAAEALIEIGNPSVLQDFITLLDESQYSPARTAAIKGIGRFGETEHAKMLYPFLRHQDEDFRGAAAGALGELNDPEAVEHLQAALQNESFPWVREVMQDSLGE